MKKRHQQKIYPLGIAIWGFLDGLGVTRFAIEMTGIINRDLKPLTGKDFFEGTIIQNIRELLQDNEDKYFKDRDLSYDSPHSMEETLATLAKLKETTGISFTETVTPSTNTSAQVQVDVQLHFPNGVTVSELATLMEQSLPLEGALALKVIAAEKAAEGPASARVQAERTGGNKGRT